MNARQLLQRIRALYQEKLAAKTSWGRNELLAAYDEAVNEAILEQLQ